MGAVCEIIQVVSNCNQKTYIIQHASWFELILSISELSVIRCLAAINPEMVNLPTAVGLAVRYTTYTTCVGCSVGSSCSVRCQCCTAWPQASFASFQSSKRSLHAYVLASTAFQLHTASHVPVTFQLTHCITLQWSFVSASCLTMHHCYEVLGGRIVCNHHLIAWYQRGYHYQSIIASSPLAVSQ